MKKLSKKIIKKLLAEMNLPLEKLDVLEFIEICHRHEWDHGYDGYTGFCGTRREFYYDFFQMNGFLRNYIKEKDIKNVIISPLHQRYYFNGLSNLVIDIYDEINETLSENKIDKRYESGLLLNVCDNWNFIEAICEGAYRDITNIGFVFPECGVVMIPHHHMNINLYSSDLNEEQAFLKEIIKDMPGIKLFRQ